MKKIIKRIIANVSLSIPLLISAPGCNSPCSELSVEEIISSVSTLAEAQECLNREISYSDLPRRIALNGASTQSMGDTFDKKEGICTDGAVAIAAMLKDNNYPSFILGVYFNESKIGHAVFVSEKDGLYSAGGINKTDYRPAFYPSLDSLAESVSKQFDSTLKSFSLFDLSILNLVQGTNESLVNIDPFVVESKYGDFSSTAKITKLGEGYLVSTIYSDNLGSWTENITYTADTYKDEIKKEWINPNDEKTYSYYWKVVSRHQFRLPLETIKESYVEENLFLYENSFIEYFPDGHKKSEKVLTSDDGDRGIDWIVQYEYAEDGSLR